MSGIDLLLRWFHERFKLRVFAPLAATLALCGQFGSLPSGIDGLLLFLVALLMLVQFRIMDEVADLPADTIAHPDRVLSRAGNYSPLIVVAVFSALVNCAALAVLHGRINVIALAITTLLAILWYKHFRAFVRHPLLRAYVLLLKYPVFVILLGEWPTETATLPRCGIAAIVYLAICLHEAINDPMLREMKAAHATSQVSTLILAGCASWFAIESDLIYSKSIYWIAALVFMLFLHPVPRQHVIVRCFLPISGITLACAKTVESWS